MRTIERQNPMKRAIQLKNIHLMEIPSCKAKVHYNAIQEKNTYSDTSGDCLIEDDSVKFAKPLVFYVLLGSETEPAPPLEVHFLFRENDAAQYQEFGVAYIDTQKLKDALKPEAMATENRHKWMLSKCGCKSYMLATVSVPGKEVQSNISVFGDKENMSIGETLGLGCKMIGLMTQMTKDTRPTGAAMTVADSLKKVGLAMQRGNTELLKQAKAEKEKPVSAPAMARTTSTGLEPIITGGLELMMSGMQKLNRSIKTTETTEEEKLYNGVPVKMTFEEFRLLETEIDTLINPILCDRKNTKTSPIKC